LHEIFLYWLLDCLFEALTTTVVGGGGEKLETCGLFICSFQLQRACDFRLLPSIVSYRMLSSGDLLSGLYWPMLTDESRRKKLVNGHLPVPLIFTLLPALTHFTCI
jgi:hypothetical protein